MWQIKLETWNLKLETVSFNLRVFTSKSGERCRNYNSLHMCLPLVKGPKVMGQSASQLFHGQVCVIPSLSQLQWADKRSRVHFKCAICIWNLLLSTVKMRSKELSLSVKQAIIRLKKQNKPIREIAKTLGMAKTTVWNILKKKERTGELSNTKRPEDHGKQLWWMTEEFFPWWRKHPSQLLARSRKHSPGGRCMCVKVNNQEKTSPEWIQRVHHKM